MKYLIIEPTSFIDKYIRRELLDNGAADDDIHVGIDLQEHVRYDCVFVHAQGEAAVVRRLSDILAEQGRLPGRMVLLSSTDIYGRDRGEDYDEDTPCTPDSPQERHAAEVEEAAAEAAASHGIRLTVLRLPPVVGTGMGGMLRKIVNGIYRGSLFKIEGNDARRSVVHAVDVARAARLASGLGGVYNLTDGTIPTVSGLMEALAHRLDDKRLFTVSLRRARHIAMVGRIIPQAMNPAMMSWMTSTLTFSDAKFREAVPSFESHSVIEYLRTHDYGDESL